MYGSIFYCSFFSVLARLGLFEDSIRPTSLNRKDPKVLNRAWRTSKIDSFASNIAFVLFKCKDDYRVTAYFQEKPVRLPGCSDDLCHFGQFVTKYGPLAANCNLDSICTV